MSEQQYTYDGRPGCVMRHRSRATGTTISIYKADQAGLNGSAGEWIAICEDHGERYAFPNLRHARAHYATAPWCAGCHGGAPPGVPAPPPAKRMGPPIRGYVSISGPSHLVLNANLYADLGQPPGLRVQWNASERQLEISPANDDTLREAAVYPVQQARRADGVRHRTGIVSALAPLRQSGLTPGRYKPKVKDGQVILKARFKIEDDQADDTRAGEPAEAQD